MYLSPHIISLFFSIFLKISICLGHDGHIPYVKPAIVHITSQQFSQSIPSSSISSPPPLGSLPICERCISYYLSFILPFIYIFDFSYYCIVYKYHMFIHSSIDGHIWHFQDLPIINYTTIIKSIHVSVQYNVFNSFKKVMTWKIAGWVEFLILVFCNSSVRMPIMVVIVSISTKNVEGFFFSSEPRQLCYCLIFW